MNRLVIIGNGFDLAHNLKTSYEHFIVSYLIRHLNEASQKWTSEDELIIIDKKGGGTISFDTIETLEEIISHNHLSFPGRSKGKYYKHDRGFEIKFKSRLFESLMINRNWTDIEKKYFEFILKIQSNNVGSEEMKLKLIVQANADLEIIKNEFISYLNNIQLDGNLNNEILNMISDCFAKNNSAAYASKVKFDLDENKAPNKVCFINFNYTDILEKYLRALNSRQQDQTLHFAIHGSLKNPEQIIFGYGDETHDEYQKLENLDIQELLENIKSFYYPANSYYDEIMEFIEDDKYDIHVIGHSLGLSDRVLLKTLFENQKCKAIKLYHRGTERSQFKKRIALSRHFSNKIEMRNKVLQFNPNDIIPQLIKKNILAN